MDVITTAQHLISIDSVTSHSNALSSQHLATLLEGLKFEIESFPYVDGQGVDKTCLAARRGPQRRGKAPGAGGIGFFCHNDVVSVDGWNSQQGGPFAAVIAQERLWGRGACDMKGPIAAWLSAIDRIAPSSQTAPIFFFMTGDEECGMAGAKLLAEQSDSFAEMVNERAVGVIGEPTSLQVVNAHKGTCHIEVSSRGVAAHSSTAEGRNANWQMIPFLSFLEQLHGRCEAEAELRNPHFSPPTLTINLVIENSPCATNITVGRSTCRIFFRPMPHTKWQTVLDAIVSNARSLGLEVKAAEPLKPLYTPPESPFVQTALQLLRQEQPLAVSYATDGCCFEQLPELIVIGPGNIEQAHRPDEWIALAQLERGVDVYHRLFRHYATEQ